MKTVETICVVPITTGSQICKPTRKVQTKFLEVTTIAKKFRKAVFLSGRKEKIFFNFQNKYRSRVFFENYMQKISLLIVSGRSN